MSNFSPLGKYSKISRLLVSPVTICLDLFQHQLGFVHEKKKVNVVVLQIGSGQLLPSGRWFPRCAWHGEAFGAVWSTRLPVHNHTRRGVVSEAFQSAHQAFRSLLFSGKKTKTAAHMGESWKLSKIRKGRFQGMRRSWWNAGAMPHLGRWGWGGGGGEECKVPCLPMS